MDTRGSFEYGTKGFQSQTAYKGIKDVLFSVYKEGGVRGLYRGVGMYVHTCLSFCSLFRTKKISSNFVCLLVLIL